MEKWKTRTIRMPDELWFKIMEEASETKKEIAELVREVLESFSVIGVDSFRMLAYFLSSSDRHMVVYPL